ncbi:MAG: DUF2062 domain-containing protein [Alphaproteobacteria bacterium]
MRLKSRILNYFTHSAGKKYRSNRFSDQLHRLFHFKLIIPVKRGKKEPEIVARGVAIGVGVALTPTVGLQMILVGMIWGLLRRFAPSWRFNLLVALGWTWVTNIVTVPFVYYAFILTGNMMMGDFHGLSSEFAQFKLQLENVIAADLGFFHALVLKSLHLFRIWGLPLFIGSLPWMILGSWLSYRLCLTFLIQFGKLRANYHKAAISKHKNAD